MIGQPLHVPYCPTHKIQTLQGVCPVCAHRVTKLRLHTHRDVAFWALDCADAALGAVEPHELLHKAFGEIQTEVLRQDADYQKRSLDHAVMYLNIATDEISEAELAEGDKLERWMRDRFRLGWMLAATFTAAAVILGLSGPEAAQVLIASVVVGVAAIAFVVRRSVGSKKW